MGDGKSAQVFPFSNGLSEGSRAVLADGREGLLARGRRTELRTREHRRVLLHGPPVARYLRKRRSAAHRQSRLQPGSRSRGGVWASNARGFLRDSTSERPRRPPSERGACARGHHPERFAGHVSRRQRRACSHQPRGRQGAGGPSSWPDIPSPSSSNAQARSSTSMCLPPGTSRSSTGML
jgi:hypothetical protein